MESADELWLREGFRKKLAGHTAFARVRMRKPVQLSETNLLLDHDLAADQPSTKSWVPKNYSIVPAGSSGR